jgi:DNA-binding NtrC family response regulator
MFPSKKILILDEDGFSKICSAMLNDEGYITALAKSEGKAINSITKDGASLIIASYPYGISFLMSKKIIDIPIIILSDEVNSDLIEIMKNFQYSVCMVKPLDFRRFKYLVNGIVNGYLNLKGGNIIA